MCPIFIHRVSDPPMAGFAISCVRGCRFAVVSPSRAEEGSGSETSPFVSAHTDSWQQTLQFKLAHFWSPAKPHTKEMTAVN